MVSEGIPLEQGLRRLLLRPYRKYDKSEGIPLEQGLRQILTTLSFDRQ